MRERGLTWVKIAHEKEGTLADYLKSYTILGAVYNLGQAWSQVTSKNMKGVWNKILKRQEEKPHEAPVEEIVGWI